jgi:hypothetical protein
MKTANPSKVVLFTGPTLSAAGAQAVLQAECRPPVAQGDVYRAALQRPFVIGIIDGYFDSVPSVWHKEILWAMSQGIHVFGSASMGALRAAELASFGIVGIGRIFQDYRDGVLEDDDEVAITHGAAEHGYRGTSDAMVNIRATLSAARADGVLSQEIAGTLESIAKNLFYPQRHYARILELAAAQGVPQEPLAAFRNWLPGGAVDQKRRDATGMLEAIRNLIDSGCGPMQVPFFFEETVYWEDLKAAAGQVRDPAGADADQLVLAALRAHPRTAERAEAAALGWWLAAENAKWQGLAPNAVSLLAESSAFCAAHRLADSSAVERWLERNQASRERLESMLAAHALSVGVRNRDPQRLEQWLLDFLRWTGDYDALLNHGAMHHRTLEPRDAVE